MFFKNPFKKETPSTPATDPLWDLFRQADGDWCCKVFMEMKKHGLPNISIYTPGKNVILVNIKFCPRCGRKL
ncbi:MAG: hypothetical protein HZB61_10190 [Nitrospirae bacterium]|nr:hypothetical protein [Nitrospirota bacterium]